jgi:hypothetical protein
MSQAVSRIIGKSADGNAPEIFVGPPAVDHPEFGLPYPPDRRQAVKEFNVVLNEEELTTVMTALEYLGNRQFFLATMATNHGRDAESQARRDNGARTLALSERLSSIAVNQLTHEEKLAHFGRGYEAPKHQARHGLRRRTRAPDGR